MLNLKYKNWTKNNLHNKINNINKEISMIQSIVYSCLSTIEGVNFIFMN